MDGFNDKFEFWWEPPKDDERPRAEFGDERETRGEIIGAVSSATREQNKEEEEDREKVIHFKLILNSFIHTIPMKVGEDPKHTFQSNLQRGSLELILLNKSIE